MQGKKRHNSRGVYKSEGHIRGKLCEMGQSENRLLKRSDVLRETM